MDVLVVDDQPTFRAVARTLVALTAGLQVAGEAASGEEAVALAADLAPQVILMDINLPGMSGIEATRQIVQAQPGVLVVLMSTYAAADLPADAFASGAVGYLRKEDLTPAALAQALAAPPAAPGTAPTR